jgi:hypothetical protein
MIDGRPTLAEVHCTPLRFQPGDRILVRVLGPCDNERKNRIDRMVTKWAGGDVEVLVYSATEMSISVETAADKRIVRRNG